MCSIAAVVLDRQDSIINCSLPGVAFGFLSLNQKGMGFQVHIQSEAMCP